MQILGKWRNSLKHGKGVLYYYDGDKYDGNFYNGNF